MEWSAVYGSEYVLRYRQSMNSLAQERRGAILRWHFVDGSVGYSDCCPCEERGDKPLSDHLILSPLTSLMTRSHYYACRDARSRAEGLSAFTTLPIAPSHCLLTSWHSLDPFLADKVSDGYSRIKIKMKKKDLEELSVIKGAFSQEKMKEKRVRLDFNGVLSDHSLTFFLDAMSDILDRIEFIEDPTPFDAESWRAIQQRYAIALAADKEISLAAGDAAAAKVLVIKPAIENPAVWVPIAAASSQKVVFTSYVDHPLGQRSALWEASQWHLSLPDVICCSGFDSYHFFDDNLYNERQLSGLGFGMDNYLSQLTYRKLT